MRTSEMKSSKSALALALPSNRNSKQQRSPKGEWNKKKFYRKVKVEDEVFKVGDDVYVCTPETVDFPEDVDHICELCKCGRGSERMAKQSNQKCSSAIIA